jgi:hypothetical protein
MEMKFLRLIDKKIIYINRGSTLLLLVIIIAVIMALGITLLSVSMTQYKIKKSNSEIKQSFYMAEMGINTSFNNAYELVIDATNSAIKKADDYLLVYPLDNSQAECIFSDSFKLAVIGQIEIRINKNENPKIEIANPEMLVFIDEKLIVSIESKYILKDSVEATTMIDLIIVVPNYDSVDSIDFASLITLDNWKIRK